MTSRVLAIIVTAALALGVAGSASAAPGDRDTSFNPPALNNYVKSVAELSDGKYLIGGRFTDAGYPYLVRLKSDGGLDTDVTPPAPSSIVNSVAALSDGQYLIGGSFATIGGEPSDYVARLNSDSSRDKSFTPPALDSIVNSVAELTDGQYLIGGGFTNDGYAHVARLNANGTRDTSFTPPALNSYVYSVAPLSDGRYLIGGAFTNAGGDLDTNFVARLNANGTRDESFRPPDLNGYVRSVAALTGGKYLIGGDFSDVGGDPDTDYVVRLNSDGTRDESFRPPDLNGYVRSVAALTGGKYLIGGDFSDVGGDSNTDYVVRLNSDGTRDPDFNPPPLSSKVRSVAALRDGKYLIGGDFTNPGYARVARLEGQMAELPEVPEDVLPENPVIIDNTDKPIGLPNNRPVYFPIAPLAPATPGWDPNARGACKRSETNKKLAKCVSGMTKLPDFTGIYALKANLSGTTHKMKGACRWDGGDSECRVYLNRRGKWRLTWTAEEKTTARTVVVP